MGYPIVRIKNVDMTYHTVEGEIKAVEKISLDVMKGEFISIVGPSGCGKSTLLSLISGLLSPTKGHILVKGEPISGHNPAIGYMLQKDHLFEWRTIWQNALIGLEVQNRVNHSTLDYVDYLFSTYGLKDFKNNYPNQLSGGMRQRTALIRTLATNPEILLLDEPFSSLDYQTRLAISDEIGSILKKESKTAILVTHDIAEAVSMSDRVAVLSKRPAYIKNIHTINLSCDNRTPLKSREAPEFRIYFNKIWSELDVHI